MSETGQDSRLSFIVVCLCWTSWPVSCSRSRRLYFYTVFDDCYWLRIDSLHHQQRLYCGVGHGRPCWPFHRLTWWGWTITAPPARSVRKKLFTLRLWRPVRHRRRCATARRRAAEVTGQNVNNNMRHIQYGQLPASVEPLVHVQGRREGRLSAAERVSHWPGSNVASPVGL